MSVGDGVVDVRVVAAEQTRRCGARPAWALPMKPAAGQARHRRAGSRRNHADARMSVGDGVVDVRVVAAEQNP